MADHDPAKPLKEFRPTKEFFIGIDSDGCAFDTMGIKQRECFCPWLIGYFRLQPVAEAVRQCKEFADLFSKTRGANRHKTTKRIISELLPDHPLVKARSFEVPQYPHYFAWVDDAASTLSNDGLKKAIAAADGEARKELELALAWSERVNWSIGEIVKDMPPFPYVRESLEKIQPAADCIVVSATPNEALRREWEEHDIAGYVKVIAGQEMGTKTEHLAMAAGGGRYKPGHVLMIGDAPGDMKAAKANNALFYPINPGGEQKSWKRFAEEAIDRFINDEYAGRYEAELIAEFDALLPEKPPWER
jgi:phosphoglycolate phosphatase-like HAD superfamily hydrolase